MEFSAVLMPDGTYTIRDVPIFSEVKKGEKNAPEDIGEAWMRDALENLKTSHREGYFPPVHYAHHGTREAAIHVGHFRAKRVGRITIRGERRFAIFVDIEGIQPEEFDRFRKGRYPNRSVEIIDWNERRIDTLALISHEAPFFPLPITIGRTLKEVPESAVFMADGAVPVAVFSFKDARSMNFEKDESREELEKQIEDLKAKLAKMSDDEKDADMADDEETSAKAKAKASEDEDAKAKAKASDDEDETKASDEEAKPKPAEPQKAKAKAKASAADADPITFARLEAENAALRDRIAEKEANDAVGVRATSAISKLEEEGYHLSDSTRETISTFSAKGADVLDEFVAQYRKTMPRDPKPVAAVDSAAAPVADEPDAVAKFAAQGPEIHQLAQRFSADYDVAVERYGIKSTREEYISAQIASGVN